MKNKVLAKMFTEILNQPGRREKALRVARRMPNLKVSKSGKVTVRKP